MNPTPSHPHKIKGTALGGSPGFCLFVGVLVCVISVAVFPLGLILGIFLVVYSSISSGKAICSECRAKVDKKANVCSHCGARFDAPPGAAEPQAKSSSIRYPGIS